MKYKILTLNSIAAKGLQVFDRKLYQISDAEDSPDAILVRSANLHDKPIPNSVKVIGRAGAGVNNIPIDAYSALGIPVLNAPGANANAVKELVITGMLLASRNICRAWDYTRQLQGDDHELDLQVEKNKKNFLGSELPEKTLAVIGLGNIGVQVANAALNLGMKVIGFDQNITVENAWKLSSKVNRALSLAEAVAKADFISLHVPLMESTENLVSHKLLNLMKSGVVLLNFSRAGIVNNEELVKALEDKKVSHYVCDFPSRLLQNNPNVIALPHLGASTVEAEENCAVMVAKNIQHYLADGTIHYSVNFPNVNLPRSEGYRLTVANRNVPNIIAQITGALSEQNINILDMINKSRDEIAYNILDVDVEPSAATLSHIQAINGVLRARKL